MFITLSGIGEYHATMVPALMICGSSVVLVIHTGIVFVPVCRSTIQEIRQLPVGIAHLVSGQSSMYAIIDIVHGSSVTSCLTSKE